MSANTQEKDSLEPIDMDALLNVARDLDDEDTTIRPAVLCNIVAF